MPDSAIDYNDPRNSTQGRERFGEQGVAEGATVAYEVEWTDKNTGEQGITTVSALTSQDAADKLVKMKLQQLDNVDVTDVFPAHKQTTDKEQGVAEGDVIPFKRPESKIKPEVRRVFIRHLLDQGYTNDEISRMNDQQFTKAYYGIKGKTKVKDVRPNWTDDLPDELDEEITPEAMATPKIQVKEQGVAEAISKNDLLNRLEKDLPRVDDPKNKDAEPVNWTGPKKGDYGYTGYQGHGMPTDRAERDRIRADKKKQQDK
jgi:hypothetical protein